MCISVGNCLHLIIFHEALSTLVKSYACPIFVYCVGVGLIIINETEQNRTKPKQVYNQSFKDRLKLQIHHFLWFRFVSFRFVSLIIISLVL